MGFPSFSRKEFTKRSEEIGQQRKALVVDLSCGHVKEIGEMKKALEAEFPGERPRCFFVRDSKYMIKKRALCEECLR